MALDPNMEPWSFCANCGDALPVDRSGCCSDACAAEFARLCREADRWANGRNALPACERCGGSGIDPVRGGLPGDELMADPEYCSECGGGG